MAVSVSGTRAIPVERVPDGADPFENPIQNTPMARRVKNGSIEEAISSIARMPWWGGVILAGIAWAVLHYFATRELPPPTDPYQAIWHLFRAFAGVGEYAGPVICLIGSAGSIWLRHDRSRLIARVSERNAASAIDGMSWREFEVLVGEAFRLQGFQVNENGGGGADGGVDLDMTKDGERFLVQCKQWRANRVGVSIVRELYGIMAARGATGGFVVTSGSFTEEAIAFAGGRNVRLVNGTELADLIHQVKRQGSLATPSPKVARSSAVPMGPEPLRTLEAPPCPICSRQMIRRTARRGPSAGDDFWGCPQYPTCRGTRQITG